MLLKSLVTDGEVLRSVVEVETLRATTSRHATAFTATFLENGHVKAEIL
jgi:hypothetical protein